jgi:hypothetical protein
MYSVFIGNVQTYLHSLVISSFFTIQEAECNIVWELQSTQC